VSEPQPHAAPAAADTARIVYCRCAYAQVVPAAVKDAVLEGLAAADRGFETVPDLCEMAARRDPSMAELARGAGPLRIAACWPRAVKGLFVLADAPLPEHGVEILNMRTDTAAAVLAGVLGTAASEAPASDAPTSGARS
jgi:hypothetical protein